MNMVWPTIVSIIILMVLWAWIASVLKERRKQKVRKSSVPYVEENLQAGVSYDVRLSDGHVFKSVVVLGTTQPEEGQFSFAGYDEALVLKDSEGKRIFLKTSSIRYIQEV